MSISKLSDRTRLLGASLKNLNPTALFNKTNELVESINYNSSTLLAKQTCDFTFKEYTVKYNNLVGGTISVGDSMQGSNAGLIQVKGVTDTTITFIYDTSTTAPLYPGEPITDITSGATATLGDYIQFNDQKITLKRGNRYIITNILIVDPTNPSLTCSHYEFWDSNVGIGTRLFHGDTLDLSSYYVDYLVSKTIILNKPVVVNNDSIYLNVAGVDPTKQGQADVYVYGIILD